MNVRATAKFVGTSNRKIGLVAELIRGRKAQEAIVVLTQTGKRATDPIGKVLASAIANAENNYNMNVRDLTIDSVLVGPGPTLKRFRPRAQGRAFPVRKRTSHITVVLSDGTGGQIAAKAVKTVAAPKPATDDATPKTDATPKARTPRATSDTKSSTRNQSAARRSSQKKGSA